MLRPDCRFLILTLAAGTPGTHAAEATLPRAERSEVRFGYAAAAGSYTSTTAAEPRERNGSWDNANRVRLDLLPSANRQSGLIAGVSVTGHRGPDGTGDDRGYQGAAGRLDLGVAMAAVDGVAVVVGPFAGYALRDIETVAHVRDAAPGDMEYGMNLNAVYSIGTVDIGGGVGYAFADGDYPFCVPAAGGDATAQTGPVYSIFIGTCR